MISPYSYKVKSPSRIDFSGGTLDCWPLYLFFLPVSTINASINIFTEVELSTQDKGIDVVLPDLNKKYFFNTVKDCLTCEDKYLSLLQEHLQFWKPVENVFFKIIIKSESPIGAGLGSSSSLCVSLLKVFKHFSENNFCHTKINFIKKNNEMVHLASNIEAQVLKMPTGTQDYFPAINLGFHILDYTAFDIKDQKLKAKYLPTLEKHLVLVYTGKPHNSGQSNWKVIKDYLEGSKLVSDTLKNLSIVSKDMKEVFLNLEKFYPENTKYSVPQNPNPNQNFFLQIPKLFAKELKLRKNLNAFFISKEIETLRNLALKSGAVEIKVCGAGSGGCVLIWTNPENKLNLQNTLKDNSYTVLDFNFVNSTEGD